MIQVEELTKTYGSRVAVNRVSFRVEKGEIVGFLGPNGAGKTTTLRILAGFLAMTSGRVTIAGFDIIDEAFEAKQKIGYMPESVPLYAEMRVVEYLNHRAELKRVKSSLRSAWVHEAMERGRVTDVATQRIGHLSKGYRQRVGLADALVAKPPILILDEPTSGLDPNQIREVRALIRELAAEHTIILSTHILSEVEATATRVIVIANGKLVAEGPTDKIQTLRSVDAYDVVVRGDAQLLRPAFEKIDSVQSVAFERASDSDNNPHEHLFRAHIRLKQGLSPAQAATCAEDIARAIVQLPMQLRELRPSGGSLEEVFASLTQDAASANMGAKAGSNVSSKAKSKSSSDARGG